MIVNTLFLEDGVCYFDYAASSIPKIGEADGMAGLPGMIAGVVEHMRVLAEAVG